jgi:exopolyphosphatase/guanosine-5'-triphosphate,3'-diphosphate pyrophosphatase
MNPASSPETPSPSRTDASAATKTVAVIDVGSTSIRMAIAEISPEGEVNKLESLFQAVTLGKDTFTSGAIQNTTIEDCVRTLKSYYRLLEEYGVTRTDQIRVVATSAVREATNRLAFLDRIYSATGIDIQALDEAEVSRITFLGIQRLLRNQPKLAQARILVMEVGGGSTELLLAESGTVAYSHTYRLGAIRLREMLQTYRAPTVRMRNIMENQIDRTVEQVTQHVPADESLRMIALGGDVRFAATQLLGDWNRDEIARLSIEEFAGFTEKMLAYSPDELVRKYHLAFPDAESMGPALLAYLRIARVFRLKKLHVGAVNLRDGLLWEMASKTTWTEDFARQVINSALDLGRKFEFNEAHAVHVAELSKTIFRSLHDEHALAGRHELILYIAALLHEIGHFVTGSSHHKHSMYLIQNSELFGLSKQDLLLVALVARYHRRASPKATHPGFGTLDRDSRIAVAKMAAILRVAAALDRSYSQRIREIHCVRETAGFLIEVPNVSDLSLEQMALKQKGPLFEETFGLQVVLRSA